MLNQHYLSLAKRLYCRIALGAESVSCSVDPKFKCIVVAATSRAHGNIILLLWNVCMNRIICRICCMLSILLIPVDLMTLYVETDGNLEILKADRQ